MEELVSIVIPTYNRADLIEEAVLSAISQTYQNKEIIVIDDGSTDNTKRVCEKYVSNGRIRYVYKQNGGIASALNRGFEEMKGMWYKWLSSDDVLELNAVEELVRFANEKNAKVVYSDYMLIDQHGNKVGEFIEPSYNTYLDYASNLWQQHIGNGSSALIHKSLFEQVGPFDTTLRFGEDYDFWLRACIVHGIMFYRCPNILLKYRVHPKQLSEKVKSDALRNNDRIHDRIKEQYVSMHGKRKWNELLNEFKKRGKVRPLWRRMTRRALLYLPEDARKSLIALYNIMGRQKTELSTDSMTVDLEWFNPFLEKDTPNAKCHYTRYELAKKFCEGKVVLDIACGSGYGTSLLAEVAKFVYGVDQNTDALATARQHFGTNQEIEYIEADVIDFLRNATIKPEVTTCLETIEHLDGSAREELIALIHSDILILSFPTEKYLRMSKFHQTDISLNEVLRLLKQNNFTHTVRYQYPDARITENNNGNAQNFLIICKRTRYHDSNKV